MLLLIVVIQSILFDVHYRVRARGCLSKLGLFVFEIKPKLDSRLWPPNDDLSMIDACV